MQVITGTITFTAGTAVLLNAVPNFAGIFEAARVVVEPAAANAHPVYVGDNLLATGSSTTDHVIKQIGKPTAADATLDRFDLDTFSRGGNAIRLGDLAVDGTTGEKARVTIFLG